MLLIETGNPVIQIQLRKFGSKATCQDVLENFANVTENTCVGVSFRYRPEGPQLY